MAMTGVFASRNFDAMIGRYALVGLELEHQIDSFADEEVGVSQCFACAVAVVDGDEVDMLTRGGDLHVSHHFAGELGVALRREADAEGLRGYRAEAILIDAWACALQQAAMDEGAQQAEDGGLGQAGAFHHVGEHQFFSHGAEGLQHFACAEHGLRFVAIDLCGSWR